MPFKLQIEPEVHIEIQEYIDDYNAKRKGFGRFFYNEVLEYFEALKINPFYQVRYRNVRCLPLKRFSHMIHFTVDEATQTVIVRALFHTSPDRQVRNR
jgi:hypothetical protein